MLKDANDCPRGLLHEAHFRRFLDKPANFLNKPSVPIHNILLAALYQKSASWLLATSLLVRAAVCPDLLLRSMRRLRRCRPRRPSGSLLARADGRLLGLAGMDIGDDLKSATRCVLVIGLSEFLHILLEATIFSIIPCPHSLSAGPLLLRPGRARHLDPPRAHHRGRDDGQDDGGTLKPLAQVNLHAADLRPQDRRAVALLPIPAGGGGLSDAHGQLSVVVRARGEVLNADVWDGIIYSMCALHDAIYAAAPALRLCPRAHPEVNTPPPGAAAAAPRPCTRLPSPSRVNPRPSAICRCDVCHNGTHKWVDVMLPSETVSAIDPTKLTRAQRNRPTADLDNWITFTTSLEARAAGHRQRVANTAPDPSTPSPRPACPRAAV
eukprot:scaffold4786_cov104-Isochrysis_galbana.AAC.2